MAEGTLTIGALTIGDHTVRLDSAGVLWEGSKLKLSGIKGRLDEAKLSGDLTADLAGRAPIYVLVGSVEDYIYKNGRINFTGSLETSGTGAQLLANLHTQGALKGRAIDFAPAADFRTVAGQFDARVNAGSLRWTFTGLDVTQGTDSYSGDGSTSADGKIVLDLISNGKPVRFTGSLLAAARP
jgi:hypothetical protein